MTVDFQLLRRGLAVMIDERNSWTPPGTTFEQVALAAAKMDRHPMSLPIDRNIEGHDREFASEIHLLQSPGVTSISVRSMAAVARNLAGSGLEPHLFRYLRTMEAGSTAYFEIGSSHGVFICGGCDKYSGEGGYGKKQLDEMFAFLVHMFGVPYDHVVVNTSTNRIIRDAWDKHDIARQKVA